MALLIAGLAVAVTVRFNSFAPWATDSGAYIAAAHRWADADVFRPASFEYGAPWAQSGHVESPLGHRPGSIKGTIVSMYPLGYPVLMAAALKMGGELAPHVVSPVLLGVLAWCAFLLGARLSTPWAGTVAALLVCATPVTLGHAIVPFSDVPAAAFWAIAWVMVMRPGYGAVTAAGCATAMAVMIRPNLAPLGAVLAVALWFTTAQNRTAALKQVVVFGFSASIGPLIVWWSQAVLYGHPFQSGYGANVDDFFSADRIAANAVLYARLLVELHSWVIVAAVAMIPLAIRHARVDVSRRPAAVIALTATGLVAVNYALYLAYLTYEGWYWLRFLLPAMLAVFVLFAAAVDQMRLWLMGRRRWAGVLAVIPVLIVVLSPRRELRLPQGYPRLHLMGHYLRAVLPDNAVILTSVHGGALTMYTGRPILRLDIIASNDLDRIISDLHQHGHRPVLVLDLVVEGPFFAHKFGNTSKFGRLDWPARAEFASGPSITYHDPFDRELFLSGDRWATDVVVFPSDARRLRPWSDMRAPLERIVFPPPAETWQFKEELEAAYRDALARPATLTRIDPRVVHTWMRRYLRYRAHDCSHEQAASRVFTQMSGASAPPLCGRPADAAFPPHDEAVNFRRQLEEFLRNDRDATATTTFVDIVGDAVWLQEYLRARTNNCAHAEATAAVMAAIRGSTASAPCVPPI